MMRKPKFKVGQVVKGMSEHLQLVPMHRDGALAFVEQHHRHAGRLPGDKFAVGAALGEKVVGVAIVGRAGVASRFQEEFTLEVPSLTEAEARKLIKAIEEAL